MSDFEFEYRLTGVGWSEATVRTADGTAHLSASYLDDALGDLVRGVLAIARGTRIVRVSWAEEPGEYRWTLVRSAAEVEVAIRWFDELWGRADDDAGRVLLATTCSVNSLCAGVAVGARTVVDTYGVESYRTQWAEHDFPLHDLEQLERSTP